MVPKLLLEVQEPRVSEVPEGRGLGGDALRDTAGRVVEQKKPVAERRARHLDRVRQEVRVRGEAPDVVRGSPEAQGRAAELVAEPLGLMCTATRGEPCKASTLVTTAAAAAKL